MPLVEIIHPQDAFDADGKKKLLESLSATCLRWEGIDVNDVTQSIAWVYLDERPRDSISAGGQPLTQNVYKVTVSVMVGFLDYGRIEGMVKEVTDAKSAIFVCTIQSCDFETVVIGIVNRQSSAMIKNYLLQGSAHALKNCFACRSTSGESSIASTCFTSGWSVAPATLLPVAMPRQATV